MKARHRPILRIRGIFQHPGDSGVSATGPTGSGNPSRPSDHEESCVRRTLAAALCLALALTCVETAAAQYNPKMRRQPSGLGVSPTFEGWYQNPDGTYTLSFGYFNLNREEVLVIEPGPDNHVSPGVADQRQPTVFTPSRSYGVFAVTVPADFGRDDRVTWTLRAHGEEWSIPGGILESYETANLYMKAHDRYPPALVVEQGGPESRGPNGAWAEPLSGRVGEPLALRVESWDRQGHGVTVRFYRHRGPAAVEFSAPRGVAIPEGERVARATATFSEPGDYVVYVRADHSDVRVAAAGLEQCCWTNAYIPVTVTR